MTDKKFVIERARVMYEGAVVSDQVLEVRTPDGAIVERQVLRHPGAVAVVAVHDGCVVFVRQYRAAIDRDLLEIPAGKLDIDGEPLEVAARRELIEEVGLDPTTLIEMGVFFTAAGFTDEVITIFFTDDCVAVDRTVDGVEEAYSEVVRLPLGQVRPLLVDGRLTDSKSLIGLFWAIERGLLDTGAGTRSD